MIFNRSHAQTGAAAKMQQPLNGFDQTVSILMVLVLPPPRETGPPVMMTLSPFCRPRRSCAFIFAKNIRTSMLGYSSASTGVTPQLMDRRRQIFGSVVMPTMSTGVRKRETSMAVLPETEQTTTALASTSTAMEQTAWEILSRLSLPLNRMLRKLVT